MSEAAERLKPELSRLSDEERADLAYFLISSLDGTESEVGDMAELLDRRSEELRSGTVVGVPAEEALGRLRAKYP